MITSNKGIGAMTREEIAKSNYETMRQGWRMRPWKFLTAAEKQTLAQEPVPGIRNSKNHGEHRSPILMGEDMCPCFRAGWDSCSAIMNAREAGSAAYLRKHPESPKPRKPAAQDATPGNQEAAFCSHGASAVE